MHPTRSRLSYDDLWSKIRPEHIFVLFGTLFGLIFVFFTPPYQVPDEPKHFFRAYQVSEGRWRAERSGDRVGGFLPQALVATAPVVEPLTSVRTDPHVLREKFGQRATPTEPRAFTPFPNTATYSPIPYLPQAAGIGFARLFGGSIWVQFYAGRLANLLGWLVIGWLALRLVSVRRWTVVFLFLLPMSVSQAASVSADVLTNALGWLALALTLHTALAERPWTRRRVVALIVVYTLLALTKPVYVLAAGSLCIIPFRAFGSRRRWWTVIGSITGAVLVAGLAWYAFAHGTFSPLQPDADPGRQLSLVLHRPDVFIEYVQRTLTQLTHDWIISGIGFFGWLRVGFPNWYYIWVVVTLGIVALIEHHRTDRLRWTQRTVLIGTFIVSAAIIILSQYIMWGTTDMLLIEGVQGRYFLPLVPLLAWCLPPGLGIRRPSRFFFLASVVWFLILVVAVINVWAGFYAWAS